MATPNPAGKPKHPRNPLWIISLFVTIAEVAAGYAATETTGEIQIVFTVFFVLFALLIALAFFLFLWFKPQVFYSPQEYSTTDILNYVKAMHYKVLNDKSEEEQSESFLMLFLIRSVFEIEGVKYSKLLTYFNPGWDSHMVVCCRYDIQTPIESQIEGFRNKLSQKIGIKNSDLTLTVDSKCDFENIKYSHSDQKDTLYHYRYAFASIANVQNYPDLIRNEFETVDYRLRWMTLAEMQNASDKTYERNADVIRSIKKCFNETEKIPLSF